MDWQELKQEQLRLARRIQCRDSFNTITTIGAASCIQVGDQLLATVVVCEYPSMKLLEKQTASLHNPLPYNPSFVAYRELPAIQEAFDLLEQEPDILLIKGTGVNHPRRIGLASHVGLILNIATIAVNDKCNFGDLEEGKITSKGEVLGFEIRTREHANPIYIAPGHNITLGSVKHIIPQTIIHPHKLPEPMHIAHKVVKKQAKKTTV